MLTRRSLLGGGIAVAVAPAAVALQYNPLPLKYETVFNGEDVVWTARTSEISPVVIYRHAGVWGPGKGAPLTAQEFDNNFYELQKAIQELIDLLNAK